MASSDAKAVKAAAPAGDGGSSSVLFNPSASAGASARRPSSGNGSGADGSGEAGSPAGPTKAGSKAGSLAAGYYQHRDIDIAVILRSGKNPGQMTGPCCHLSLRCLLTIAFLSALSWCLGMVSHLHPNPSATVVFAPMFGAFAVSVSVCQL